MSDNNESEAVVEQPKKRGRPSGEQPAKRRRRNFAGELASLEMRTGIVLTVLRRMEADLESGNPALLGMVKLAVDLLTGKQ